jgi:hypothetical protein
MEDIVKQHFLLLRSCCSLGVVDSALIRGAPVSVGQVKFVADVSCLLRILGGSSQTWYSL